MFKDAALADNSLYLGSYVINKCWEKIDKITQNIIVKETKPVRVAFYASLRPNWSNNYDYPLQPCFNYLKGGSCFSIDTSEANDEFVTEENPRGFDDKKLCMDVYSAGHLPIGFDR